MEDATKNQIHEIRMELEAIKKSFSNNSSTVPKQLFNTKEAMEITGLKRFSFDKLIEKGLLTPIIINDKDYYYTRGELEQIGNLHLKYNEL